MFKELLKKYSNLLENDTLFPEEDIVMKKFYDPIHQTVGMGHFKILSQPSDVKWGTVKSHIIGSQTFERCFQLVKVENRTKIKDL